jgi:cytidylate kinase
MHMRWFAMNIVFILGPFGAGKSTLAEQLAARLGFLFYDVDQFPRTASKSMGCALSGMSSWLALRPKTSSTNC